MLFKRIQTHLTRVLNVKRIPDAFKTHFGRVSNTFSVRLKLVTNAFKRLSNASETRLKRVQVVFKCVSRLERVLKAFQTR